MFIAKNKIIQKIKLNYNLYGIKVTLGRVVKSITRKLFSFSWEKCYLLSIPVQETEISLYPATRDEIIIRELTLNDYQSDLWSDFFTDKKRKTYEERMKDNQAKGYGLFINNQLAFSSWILFGSIEVQGKKIPYTGSDKIALIYDSYCNKLYRRQGFHKLMTNWKLKSMKREQIDICYVIVHAYNKPSLKTQIQSGFTVQSSFYVFHYRAKKYCTLKKIFN